MIGMKPKIFITLILTLFIVASAAAQNEAQIDEQKRVIEALEKKIAREEQEISKLKQGKNEIKEKTQRLTRQIENRNQLLTATEKQARLLREDIKKTNAEATSLSHEEIQNKEQYADMVREAYRNYKHNNYLTYIFASKNFEDVARKISNLREMSAMREAKLHRIANLSEQVSIEKTRLDKQNRALDSVRKKLTSQRTKLQRDSRAARENINQLSKREQASLRRKIEQEQQLDVAINELRKLTKGNKEGDTFSKKTSGLNLPVVNGRVKKYRENMAEIVGPQGANVVSIYNGKVVDIKRNRITNKYDVYIAHGEYITSYANLGETSVAKGAKVSKNQTIGIIGSSLDAMTMESEYKIVFGIYSPSPSEQMSAAACFKK